MIEIKKSDLCLQKQRTELLIIERRVIIVYKREQDCVGVIFIYRTARTTGELMTASLAAAG